MYFGFISSFEPTNVDEYHQKVNCMNKHKLINDQSPTSTDQLKEKCHMVYKLPFLFQIKTWIDTFSSLGDKRVGYARERVTCYMHAAAYHIPHMITQYKTIQWSRYRFGPSVYTCMEHKLPKFIKENH